MTKSLSHTLLRKPASYSAFALFALSILVLLAACGDSPTPTPGATPTMTPQANQSAPPDLTVTYQYRAGSMPPPYHNEYTVSIGPGVQGHVNYSPDYPSDKTPVWTEVFTPTTAQLDQLYSIILANRLTRKSWSELSMPPVGGSVEWATITVNNQTTNIPHALEASDTADVGILYAYVRDTLVPKSIWDSLEAQRDEWEKNYK